MNLLPRLLVWSVTTACVVLAPSNFAQQGTTMSAISDDKSGPIVKAPAGTVEDGWKANCAFQGHPLCLASGRLSALETAQPNASVDRRQESHRLWPECFQPKPQLSNIYAGNPMPMSETASR